MRHARLIFSSLGLGFGLMILLVSFTTANTALSANGSYETSNKEFYVNQPILPDHVAYPLVMVMDRTKLEMATPQERVYMQVEFANRRYDYTKTLLERENTPLALTTLTKSQKYLLQAADEALELDDNPELHTYVAKTLEFYQQQIPNLKQHFTDGDRAQIDQILKEQEVFMTRLNQTAAVANKTP